MCKAEISLDWFGKKLLLTFGGIFHLVWAAIPNVVAESQFMPVQLHTASIALMGLTSIVYLLMDETISALMSVLKRVIGAVLFAVFSYSAIAEFAGWMKWGVWGNSETLHYILAAFDVIAAIYLLLWLLSKNIPLDWLRRPILAAEGR